eukprot:1159061-Pelagomonas_calceolata.AAC.16
MGRGDSIGMTPPSQLDTNQRALRKDPTVRALTLTVSPTETKEKTRSNPTNVDPAGCQPWFQAYDLPSCKQPFLSCYLHQFRLAQNSI